MSFPIQYLPFDCVRAFASNRNKGLNISFLKENGELLSIALNSGLSLSSDSLALYEELYSKIDKFCELYPPFFRFFLAITLDLEDLGMHGRKGEALIDFVLKNDLYAYDTSDTRRMEIINLLSRRGRVPSYETDDRASLDKRVAGFLERPDRFLKFNRPLFYEFTHLIFYATNFGKEAHGFGEEIFVSLTHIGMLAYLDSDYDLLSEVCLCFSFLGHQAPKIWIEYCRTGRDSIDIRFQKENNSTTDDYHIYLVISWLMAQHGIEAFSETYQNSVPIFTQKKNKKSTLSKIFQTLHPMVLGSSSVNVERAINISAILTAEDTVRLKTALSISPKNDDFLDKITNGLLFTT